MTMPLRIKNLNYSIPYSQKILDGLDFEIKEGEFLGILGHNGSGKTTLLDLILGLRKVSSGEIQVFGEDPHQLNRSHKEKVIFLSQDVMLKGSLSISEFLDMQSCFYPLYSKVEEARLLSVFSLDKDQKIGALSTGQQKKVQFVAGLAAMPKLVLIDEVTAVLDPQTRDIFFKEIKKAQLEQKISIILTTNIAEDLIGMVDKVLFIKDKKGTFHRNDEILDLFNIRKSA
jgi:ABC-2 type transport system ATP-binding protein